MQKSIVDLLPEWSADTPVTADNLKRMVEAIRTAFHELDLRLPTAGGTVNGDLNVTESLKRNGNSVYDTENKPTATDVGAVPQKKCTIDLLHLSKDFYYPVVFNNSTNSIVGAMQYDLVRYSHQDGERNPNLYANIILRGVGWGDNGTYFHMNYSITHVPESKLIGKITVPLEDNRFVVYLKGGYSYYLTSTGLRLDTFNTQIIETEMTVEHTHVQPFHVSGATPLEYGVFEAVNQYGFEITGTKYMRLKGTYLTDDGERVYSPNNQPAPEAIGAVNAAASRLTDVTLSQTYLSFFLDQTDSKSITYKVEPETAVLRKITATVTKASRAISPNPLVSITQPNFSDSLSGRISVIKGVANPGSYVAEITFTDIYGNSVVKSLEIGVSNWESPPVKPT